MDEIAMSKRTSWTIILACAIIIIVLRVLMMLRG